ncbi:MAG: sialate O-acetylesterase [Verrucomicrobiae bacterium]|nr:sialate O-acetylesterase [Verrucomicrobiae bacterium]
MPPLRLPAGAPALAAALLLTTPVILADIRLPGLFTDHAVLQQKSPIPVWGWAEPGESVAVEFRGHTQQAIPAADGRWHLQLPRQRAGGPDTLTVRGRNHTVVLTNILVGEVWICSGQSNMEWPMHRSENPQPAIDAATHPHIRLFKVPKLKAESPVDDVAARWQPCQPATVRDFSAVAYFFGAALEAARDVPIGLIQTAWGGSPAEVWIREDAMWEHDEFRLDILNPHLAARRRFQDQLVAWEAETARLRAEDQSPSQPRPTPGWQPAELYNGMIHPLLPYAIAGAIWYQGESNASRADQYARLYPTLIRNWRHDWAQGDFPFLAVQLAPWDRNRNRSLDEITAHPVESDWAELREAQGIATRVLPRVGLAVITDVGDKDDIHPSQKRPVGERLALAARSIAYGERLVAGGPLLRSARFSQGRARIRFDQTGTGLEVRGEGLQGFQICGPDHQWVWANAQVTGRTTVEVSHPSIPQPVAVRFGWADFPVVNLFNREGLPASPFRTDDFPLTTARKP